jgi:hypothetical protein
MEHDANMMAILECVFLATEKLASQLGRFPTREEVVEETELMFKDVEDELSKPTYN